MAKTQTSQKQLTKKDVKDVVVEVLAPFAKAVKKDFDRIDKRFEQVNKRFEQVDKRFEQVDKRFDQVGLRLTGIEFELRETNKRVAHLEEQVQNLFNKMDKLIGFYERQQQEITIMSAQIKRLEDRIVRLEAEKSEK